METYTTLKGDTLGAIATKYGVPLTSISGYASGDPNRIGVGENLTINKSPSVVNAADLSKPQAPLTTPTPPPATGYAGLSSTADSIGKTIKDNLATTISSLQPTQDANRDQQLTLMEKIGLSSKTKQDLYDTKDAKTGLSVNDIKSSVDSLTSQMEAADLSARRKIEKITNENPNGMFGSGAQGEIDRIGRENARQKADLAIVLLAKTRQFDSMKNVIDAKVDAETESEKANLQSLQLFYNENKAKLDKADQRLYEQQITEQTQALGEAKELRTNIAQIQADIASNGAPLAIVQKVGAAKTMTEAYQAAGSYFGQLDRAYKQMQIDKLRSDIAANNIGGSGGDPSQILAYAQQYASTGAIPTGLPKGTFGLVAQVAKELPKPEGTLVDINTGIKPSKLSSSQSEGIVALKDLSQKLTEAEELYKGLNTGLVSGAFKTVFPSNKQQQYDALRSEIVDLLARARTGAAINASEEALYMGKIPGKFNKTLFLGGSGENKLEGLKNSIDGKLTTNLKTNGLAIYGYSEVDLGGQKYKVGDVVKGNDGQLGRVNPDGSISLISSQ